MGCVFFGHRDSPLSLKEKLEALISELISEGIKDFFVGNNGNFDYLVQTILASRLKGGADINVQIVLSFIDEKALSQEQWLTVFPEELVFAPKRLRILKRNAYMLKKASVLVSYVKTKTSNAYKLLSKASESGLRIINLTE